VAVYGGDADIAAALRVHPDARVCLAPESSSDLARAVGLGGGAGPGTTDLSLDAIVVDPDGEGMVAVNAVVVGVAPDRLGRRHRRRPVAVTVDGRSVFSGRATTVVVASGQYLRGADVVPRGHPGDGRIEVQVYALEPGQRAEMRRRIATGSHVPHPAITEASGRRVEVAVTARWPVEVDGRAGDPTASLTATVQPHAWKLVV
jgi:hypothetical protein